MLNFKFMQGVMAHAKTQNRICETH